jgi:hypothetical protein
MARRKWLPLDLTEAERIAASPTTPVHLRLYFLAFVRNRGDGHCHFRQGEMARELGIDSRNTSRAVKDLVKLGLAYPESSARCVVLPFGHNMATDRLPWCRWHESRKPKLRPGATKNTPELRHGVTGSVSELRPGATKLESVFAGQGVAPSSSSTYPPTSLSPAVSVVTRGQLLLTAGRPPIACKAAWRAAA